MQRKDRFTRFGLSTIIAGVIAITAGTAIAATTCYDFSAMAVGTSWNVGDSLSLATATVEFRRFQSSAGTWNYGGAATVRASNNAQGSLTKELNLNNINLVIFPNTPAYSANFLYADLGGNVNFGVNGDFRNTGDLQVLDGTTVGGCDIAVSEFAVLGGVYGEVTITPTSGVDIDGFGVGGQEFFVDDICFDC